MSEVSNGLTAQARKDRTGSGGAKSTPTSIPLIVGIGDLHGHYPALEHLLDGLHSTYHIFRPHEPDRLRRDVTLVFTGDYIDRGDDALGIIDRLRTLDARNPGQIITLLGNHELMALEDYDEAVALLGRCRRTGTAGAIRDYGSLTTHGGNGGTEFIREFGRTSLPALQSYVDRMAPTGDVGRWMRTLLPCYRTQIAGRKILFMHADLHETFRDRRRLESHLEEMKRWMISASADVGGTRKKWMRLAEFVWDRSYSTPEPISKRSVDSLCQAVGVDFIVTGHTPHPSVDGIKVHGGRIFDIDVRMTPAYGENMPEALVFSDDAVVGFRADGRKHVFQRFGTAH
jgi:hypothetical protein